MYSPRKFVKNHKFSGLEIYSAKLECAHFVYIRAMNGRSTSSIKMKQKSVDTREIV